MIAVAWADWTEFRQSIGLFVWGIAGIVMALALVIGGLKPEFPALLIGGIVFVLGWALGNQRWNQRKAWDWASETGVSSASYVVGKVLGLFLLTAATALFVEPLVLLVVIVTGVTAPVLLWTLVWTLILGLWPLLVGLLATQGPGPLWPFVGVVLLVLALVEASALPQLQAASPFIQLWNLYQSGDGTPGLGPLVGHAVALVGCGAAVTLAYRLNPRFH